ncbi:MAG: hypothetical protein ACFCU7_12450 [Pleurocapsa sp.]
MKRRDLLKFLLVEAIVTWLVLKQPVLELQIVRFLKVISHNPRPLQALNHRALFEFN